MPALLQVPTTGLGRTTFEEVPALFIPQSKLIVVSEFYKSKYSWDKVEIDMLYALAHEVGHAVDHSLNGVSNTRRFKKTYMSDYVRLNADDKSRLAYFIQSKSQAGRKETFAEIFSSVVSKSHCADIEQKFPGAAKLVREVLAAKLSMAG